MVDETKNKALIKSEKKTEYDEDEELGGAMTFLEHLGELRERLIRAIVAFSLATIICFIFSDHLLKIMMWPLPTDLKMTYNDRLEEWKQKWNKKESPNSIAAQPNGEPPPPAVLSATEIISNPTAVAEVLAKIQSLEEKPVPDQRGSLSVLGVFEGILVYVKLSVIAGIFLAFPFIFYEVWMFIAPGLYKREKKIALPLVLAAWICFVFGGLFCYFGTWGFILTYMATAFTPESVQINWALSYYVSTTTNFLLAFGVIFEEPVVFALLALIGVVSSEWLKKFRAYAIVVIFIVAAVITPPDPFSQTICAIPLCILYEISIVVVRIIERGRAERRGEDYTG